MEQRIKFDSVEFILFDDDNYSIGDPNGKLLFELGMHDNSYNSDGDNDEDKQGDVVTYSMYAVLDGKFWLTFYGKLHSIDALSSLYEAVRCRKAVIEFTDRYKKYISITFRSSDCDKTLLLRNIEDDTIRCLRTYSKENRLERAEAKIITLEQTITELTKRLAKYETI